MDLIKIIDQHTQEALEQAEKLQTIVETTAGFNAIQNDRTLDMLADTQSLLSQVLRSIEDAKEESGPSKIIHPDPEVWRQ